MSYETAIVLFIIFLIPAGIFLGVNIIHLRQHEKEEQSELDLFFTTHKNKSGKINY